MKNRQDSQSNRLKWLGTSLMLSLPLIGTAMPGYAGHGDRVSSHLNNLTRENWRAARIEARDQRRADRQNNHIQHAINTPTASTIGIGSNPIVTTPNTAVLFPGQVSTFHTARPRSTYMNDNGRSKNISRGVSFDLSSTNENITVGENLLNGSTTIVVGGESKTISAGSKVTAAEYAALNQKLATGSQTLTLDGSGAADGGSLNLNTVSNDGATIRASELVIPKNVTVTGDFARTADGVRVTQDIVNYGSLIATSSNAAKNTAVIGARDIDNLTGGSISSQSSISNPELNLALRADRDLNNDGSITSAGALELSAGRSINNTASVGARGDVLLNAPQINTHGNVSSENGDVTLTAPNDSALAVNGYGGTISAANGSINVRTADYDGTNNSTLFGGNYLSRELNLNAGQGSADLTANEVTGTLNTSGLAAHVSTSTDNLIIGNQCLTGDPTYYNTGNIILGGSIQVGENLAIIAGGNITVNPVVLLIKAQTVAGAGQNIVMVAGANVVSGSGETPAILNGQPPIAGNTTGTVGFTGASVTGGNIDLTGATSSMFIDSRAAAASGLNGGNITLAAYSDASGNQGKVLMNSNAQINSSGDVLGVNGSVNIVAGSRSGTAISLGSIIADGGLAGGGAISIANRDPKLSSGASIQFDTTGSIITGNSIVASVTGGGGDTNINAFIQGNSVSIDAGGKIATSASLHSNSSIVMTANGKIDLNGDLTASAGMLLVTNDSLTVTGPMTFHAESGGGNGANVVIATGANFDQTATTVTITGDSSVAAAQMDLGNAVIFSNTSLAGSAAGKVTLLAFDGNGSGGLITSNGGVQAGANGGTGGNVTIITEANSGTSIIDAVDTSGGAARTGDIRILDRDIDVNLASTIQKSDATYTGSFVGLPSNHTGNLQVGQVFGSANFIVIQTGGSLNITSGVSAGILVSGDVNGGFVALVGKTGVSCGPIAAPGFGTGGGGQVIVDSGTGTLTVGNIVAFGGNTGTGGSGGSISLESNSLTTLTVTSTLDIRGRGTAGDGGQVSFSNFGTGGINLTAANILATNNGEGAHLDILTAGQLTLGTFSFNGNAANASVYDGDISITADSIVSTGAVSLTTTGGMNGGDGLITIFTSGGGINTNGHNFTVVAGDALSIDLSGNSVDASGTTTGAIFLDGLSVDAANATFNTSATGVNGTGGSQTFSSASTLSVGNLTANGVGNGNGGDISVTATSGNVSLAAVSTLGGSSGGGNGDFVVSATDGNITATGNVTVGDFTANLNGTTGGAASFTANNSTNTISANGTGSFTFSSLSNAINVQALTGNLDVDLTTNDAQGVTFNQDVTLSGILQVHTPNLTNAHTVSADSILIDSTGNLVLDGGAGGTLTGTVPTAGSPGSPSTPPAIQITTGSSNNSLTLQGAMTFNGDVAMNNANGNTTVSGGANYLGNNNITLTTINLTLNGSLAASNLILTGKTIVSNTDVNLGANVTFHGSDLLIVAGGNVNLGNITIDLSSAGSGDSGDLTIFAGFDVDQTFAVQTTTQAPLNITGVSGPGNVTGTANIVTSSATGNAGNVSIYANQGTISFGQIDASSSSAAGGNVTIYGNSVTTNLSIITGGTSSDGSVEIRAADPSPSTFPFLVTAGVVSGASIGFSQTIGPVSVADIVAGSRGSVTLANSGGDITTSGNITAHNISILSGGNLVLPLGRTFTAGIDTLGGQLGGSIFIAANDITGAGNVSLIAHSGNTQGLVDVEVTNSVTIGTNDRIKMIDVSGTGKGGNLLVFSNNITINNGGILAGPVNGDGATIRLFGDDTLTLNDKSFVSAANATGINHNGGILVLDAPVITYTSSAADPLALSANGTGSGNGGSVSYKSNDALVTTVVGNPTTKLPKGTLNFLTASVLGENAGSVTIQSGSNLIVDTTALDIAAQGGNGNGAIVALKAQNLSGKTGNLVIIGDLDADGNGSGFGGVIDLRSSNKLFEIGTTKAPKNGIQGAISALGTGGAVTIVNSAGGISLNNSTALQAPTVALTAGGKGAITTGKGVTLSASNSLDLATDTGSIGKKTLTIDTATLRAVTTSGNINIVNQGTGLLQVTQVTMNSGDFTLSTAGSLQTNNGISTGNGSISLTAGTGNLLIGANVLANNGGIVIANTDTFSGALSIADNVQVKTSGKGDQVVLAIGEPPKKGTNTTPPTVPTGITEDIQPKGQIFYGPVNTIVVFGAANVHAYGKNVIFNNATTNNLLKIQIGNNVLIEADPPPRTPSIDSALNMSLHTASPVSEIALSTMSSSSTITSANFDKTNNSNLLTVAAMQMENSTGTNYGAVAGVDSQNNRVEDLTVNAAFHSDRDMGQAEFAAGNVFTVSEDNAEPGTSSGKRSFLKNGNIVVAPFADTSIETLHGDVKIKAGAIVVIAQSSKGLSVYDLHDSSKNAVVVEAGNKALRLSPGSHITIHSGTTHDYASVNPIELVQHRSLKHTKIDGGRSIYTSEFSIPSACFAVKPLRQLMQSKHAEAVRLSKRVIKTAAVLMTISPDRGDFTQYFNPQVTAMRN